MIICESATQTINLYVSVIKFLRYEGIIWSGDSLPLQIAPLGDLFQTSVKLKARDEETHQGEALWAMDNLHAHFVQGKKYDLEMRVEYRLPVETTQFEADFKSIHPNNYTFIIDFPSKHVMGDGLMLNLGQESHDVALTDGWRRDLPQGGLHMTRQGDYCSAKFTANSNTPYSHRDFPVFSFAPYPVTS